MKSIIIALALLFATASIAAPQIPIHIAPEEFPQFMEDNIRQGVNADIGIFVSYFEKTYEYGNEEELMAIAIRYGLCSVVWREAVELGITTDYIDAELFAESVWRSEVMTKFFILRMGGDINKVDTGMLPFLSIQPIVMTDAVIYTCSALDVAAILNMEASGVVTEPPADWNLESLPEVPSIQIGPKEPSYDS